jgi:hypothetical protein
VSLFAREPCETCNRIACQDEGSTVDCLRVALAAAQQDRDRTTRMLVEVREAIAAMNGACARALLPGESE